MKLYPHQQKAVDELHNGAILCAEPGTGKTITALYYYWTKVLGGVTHDFTSIRDTRDVYVITTARKRDSLDWAGEASHFGISTDRDSSVHHLLLTVDSWNNIDKYSEVKDAFFVFDEQRLVGSGAWTKSFLKIAKHNQWIMLSATPGDTWLDYIPVFLANGFYKNRTEFKREHVVYKPWSKFPQVDRYVGVGRLVRLRNSILVRMPYESHTVRVSKDIEVDYDIELYEKVVKKRWHVFEERPLLDAAELYSVRRKVVTSDSSRMRAIKKLLYRHPKLIVFYNQDFELEILRGLSETYSVAEWNGHKHEPIPETDSWVYLVQYVAGAEAWNCVATDAMCFYSMCYSWKNWHQAHGRIDRLNTPFTVLYYYRLISKSAYDRGVALSLKNKKNFNETDLD